MLKGLLYFMSLVIPFNTTEKMEWNRQRDQEQAEDTLQQVACQVQMLFPSTSSHPLLLSSAFL